MKTDAITSPVGDMMQVPICNVVLEGQVLSTLMLRQHLFAEIEGQLDITDFSEAIHADLFSEIEHRIARQETYGAAAMVRFADTLPDIDATLSARQYVTRLVVGDSVAYDLKASARELRRLAKLRRVRAIAYGLLCDASDPNAEPSRVISTAEIELFAASESAETVKREWDIEEAVDRAIKSANAAYENGGGLVGLSTGLIDLDAKLGGLQDTDLIVLAGRPSMGKTALATNIARSVAEYFATPGNPNGYVHFFSQEMSAEQLGMRLIAEKSGVSSDRLRRGTFNETELRSAVDARDHLANLPMIIDETGGLTIAQLAVKARRIARSKHTRLMVIDYIQLMGGNSNGRGNRTQDITEITTGLKALAKELKVPILALSQLSRAVEQREDKRPMLSDLRESGSIEQDADVVMFVYRDDYYLAREEPDEASDKWYEWKQKSVQAEGKAEVILGKSRHGPIGTIKLGFDAGKTSFVNLARTSEVNAYASRS